MALKDMPQSSKQHAVPQNIMDVEFKLIGDLTMRQFAYLMMFGGAAYMSFVSIFGLFRFPVTLFFILLGLAFAFVPIQERGMDEWIVNFFRSVYQPTQRVWKKEVVVPSALMQQSIHVVKQELITLAPTSSRRKLEDYLNYGIEEVRVDPLDIPEMDYIMKVQNAFGDVVPKKARPAPAVGVSVIEPEEPVKGQPEETKPKETTQPEAKGEKPAPPAPEEPKREVPEFEIPKRQQVPVITLEPMTPDRHSGRKFTNLLPSAGELILPIRGEKKIKTSEEQELEADINEKAQKLNQLMDQIKSTADLLKVERQPIPPPIPGEKKEKPKLKLKFERPEKEEPEKKLEKEIKPKEVKKEVPKEPETTEGVSKEAERIVERLKKENEKLAGEIERIKQEIAKADTQQEIREKQVELKKLQEEKDKKAADYARLQRQIIDLRERMGIQQQISGEDTKAPRAVAAVSKPNVLSGFVKDSSGRSLEGVLLILKNDRGEPVRAFKTNAIGQFMLSTPLGNGVYTIEVSSSDKLNLTFDIISVEATGVIMPPVEIVGK